MRQDEKIQTLLSSARSGRSLLIVVPGSGLIVKCAVDSSIDALMVLNAGLYRTLGTGTLAAFLPYGNANDQTEQLLREQVLPRSEGLPIIAGVFAADPTRPLQERLRSLQQLGITAVVNWPAVGFIDGGFREQLEAEGLGNAKEAEMLALAKSMGLTTFGFALAASEVERFLDAEVDGLILDVGLTHSYDDIPTKRDKLQQAISRLNRLSAVADNRPDCVRLVFGGPITTPEDLHEVFRHASIHGFAGGSVFERLPVRDIVSATMRRFKAIAGSFRGAGSSTFGKMVGDSPRMRQLFDVIERVSPQDVTVCIEGETGTGKELVAAMLHRLSPRANYPFVTLNCGAIPESLLESELFGHERGAFTGAERVRPGKFELAHGGTLFLDEIADLSLHGQVAMLRVLQQGEMSRVGGDTSIPVDVRVLTASNRPLNALVASGDFRADLYYRLSTVTIPLPPLRERRDDIPLLVESILSNLRARLNREITGLSAQFESKLSLHAWPGNIRELEHVLHRCAVLEDGAILKGWSFEPSTKVVAKELHRTTDSPTNRERAEQALLDANGNKTRAAAALNVTRKTLYRWLRDGTSETSSA